MQQLSWQKWRIVLIVLPGTVVFCSLKWAIHTRGWDTWSFDPLTSALFAAATLVIAFILGSTLGDYRMSEGLPAELCNAIESIHDTNLLAAASHPEYNPQPLLETLIQFLQQVRDKLQQEESLEPILVQISELNSVLADLAKYSSPPLMSRVQAEQAKLRPIVTKIQGIRDTNFLASAYAILEVFTVGVGILLLLITSAGLAESLFQSGFLFATLIYLQILIRDLDNPFQYRGKSAADVGLSILDVTRDRLQNQLAALQKR
jgi:hypothetical protein